MSDTENIVVAEEVVTKHDKHHEVVEAEEVTTNALHQANLADKVSVVEEANDEKLALHVIDLSYSPPKEFLKNVYEVLRGKMNELKIGWVFPSLREVHRTAYRHVPLRRINFTAVAGEVTAILGNHNERHQVISLLAGRTISGHYDGEIFLSGKGIDTTSYYYDKMAYVQRVSLFFFVSSNPFLSC